MAGFFKSFGKGILYLFVLPFLLVFLALYGIYGLGAFIFLFVKSVVLFFTGRSLNDDLPEDKKAKEILDAKAGNQVEEEKPVEQDNTVYYKPMVNPFFTPEANEDPMKKEEPATIEEGLFGASETQTEKEAVLDEPQQDNNDSIDQINSSIDDLLEDPIKEEKIDESVNNPQTEDRFETISTSTETNKYQPRGLEEYTEDMIDDEDSVDDGVDITFDR